MASTPKSNKVRMKKIVIQDMRPTSHEGAKIEVEVDDDQTMAGLYRNVQRSFNLEGKTFVLCTTDRELIKPNKDIKKLKDNETLMILESHNQALSRPLEEKINYEPHYHTLTQSGAFEYVSSNDRKALTMTFAELVDNSLGATMFNRDRNTNRDIEIRFYLDEGDSKNSMVVVADNGTGMTTEELNNWAIFKKSKFLRESRTLEKRKLNTSEMSALEDEDFSDTKKYPRFLNSQISYFGAGGKQAAFFIGQSVHVITKSIKLPDVKELTISEKEFMEKEKEKRDTYEGRVTSRQVGDASKVPVQGTINQILRKIIEEEKARGESFTFFCISDLPESHINDLKDPEDLKKQLAHVYHYYLHGPYGNYTDDMALKQSHAPDICKGIDIRFAFYKVNKNRKITDSQFAQPTSLQHLRDVEDKETILIRKAVAYFEFDGEAGVNKDLEKPTMKKFQGIIRYYPFLYESETLPDFHEAGDEDDTEASATTMRKSRPVFDCYWNGRLIPETKVDSLRWTSYPRNSQLRDLAPEDAFNRIAGSIWCNDGFTVTQNKLTFQNSLSEALNVSPSNILKPDLFFSAKDNRGGARKCDQSFLKWLFECHKKYDKQIKFSEFESPLVNLPDQRQEMQYPWSKFKKIVWEKTNLKVGDRVKTFRTSPIVAGVVEGFFLHGDHSKSKNPYGTLGYFKLKQLPENIFTESKYYKLSNLHREAAASEINGIICRSVEKMPESLLVDFCEYQENENTEKAPAYPIKPGQTITVGQYVGPFQVDIVDKNKQTLKGVIPLTKKKFVIRLSVYKGDEQTPHITHESGEFSQQYFYWFRHLNPWTTVGKWRIVIQALIKDKNGRELKDELIDGIKLPSWTTHFVTAAGAPANVVSPSLPGEFQRIGQPVDIPMSFIDEFDNDTAPSEHYSAHISIDDGMKVTHTATIIQGKKLVIKNVKIFGKLPDIGGREVSMNITLKSQSGEVMFENCPLSLKCKAGIPEKLVISPEEGEVHEIENGTLPRFAATVMDVSGNMITNAIDDRLLIHCKLYEKKSNGTKKDLPGTYVLDSLHGPDGRKSELKGGSVVKLALKKGEERTIAAHLFLKHYKNVPYTTREITVKPSESPASIKLFCPSDFDNSVVIEIPPELEWTAGGFLNDITFKLYDEVNEEIKKANLTKANITISWRHDAAAKDFTDDDLNEGKLPRIKAPVLSGDKQFYSVAFHDNQSISTRSVSTVEYGFNIVARPGQAKMIVVGTKPEGNKVKVGEQSEHPITIKVCDKYMNGIAGITENSLSDLQIFCSTNPIDKDVLVKAVTGKDGVFEVRSLKFQDAVVGDVMLDVRYKDLTKDYKISLVPGTPKLLKWEFEGMQFDQTGHIPITKNDKIGIAVQLYDAYNNKAAISDVEVSLGISKDLVMVPNDKSKFTNDHGKADFGKCVIGLVDKLPVPCTIGVCTTRCFGLYPIRAKATIAGSDIYTDKMRFHLLCDQSRPHKFAIACAFDIDEKEGVIQGDIVAGGEIPLFQVDLQAEDGTPIEHLTMADVVAEIWKLNNPDDRPFPTLRATTFENDQWAFQISAPKFAGSYSLQFSYKQPDIDLTLKSIKFTFHVKCGPPHRFEPVRPVQEQYVSNTARPQSRTIASKVDFQLFDRFNNLIGGSDDDDADPKFGGTLKIQVLSMDPACTVLPQLNGNVTEMEVPIQRGKAKIPNISLEEKTPGVDGMRYMLKFTPNFPKLVAASELLPFELNFVFINDAEKQEKMNCLEQKKHAYSERRKTAETKKENLLREFGKLRDKHRLACSGRNMHLHGWRQSGQTFAGISDELTVADITRMIEETEEEQKHLIAQDRDRHQQQQPRYREAPVEQQVLGKICHLAQLDDPQVAHVLGWHMMGDLDTIVTYTKEKALDLDRRFQNRQQLLSVDNIFRGNSTRDWNGPLPHEKIRSTRVNVTGNPVYLRTLLRFTKDEETSRIVFASLLGDTLLMDTMDDAINYRTQIVRHFQCPTIITRDGRRLRSNGKFGGGGNQAPSELRQGTFGLAPNPRIAALTSLILNLKTLKELTRIVEDVNEEMEAYRVSTAAEDKEIHKELDEITKGLADCERQIVDEDRRSHNARLSASFSAPRPVAGGDAAVNGGTPGKRPGVSTDEQANSYGKRKCP